MDLTNAAAIVTGGAGDFATVRRLAQMGAKVVIADVSDERGEALAKEVGAASLYIPTDCMDEDTSAKVASLPLTSGRCAPPRSPTSARTGPAAAGPSGCWTPRAKFVHVINM